MKVPPHCKKGVPTSRRHGASRETSPAACCPCGSPRASSLAQRSAGATSSSRSTGPKLTFMFILARIASTAFRFDRDAPPSSRCSKADTKSAFIASFRTNCCEKIARDSSPRGWLLAEPRRFHGTGAVADGATAITAVENDVRVRRIPTSQFSTRTRHRASNVFVSVQSYHGASPNFSRTPV